jgi:hypothetical protein
MPTPAAVEPPTPENVHLYRAACLVWKRAWRDELRRNDGNHKLANPHAPEHAAGLAVRELARDDLQRGRLLFGLPKAGQAEGILLVLRALDVKRDAVDIALFALGRTAGWIAQWKEMIADPEQKIGRPRQLYIGEKTRQYVPLELRP